VLFAAFEHRLAVDGITEAATGFFEAFARLYETSVDVFPTGLEIVAEHGALLALTEGVEAVVVVLFDIFTEDDALGAALFVGLAFFDEHLALVHALVVFAQLEFFPAHHELVLEIQAELVVAHLLETPAELVLERFAGLGDFVATLVIVEAIFDVEPALVDAHIAVLGLFEEHITLCFIACGLEAAQRLVLDLVAALFLLVALLGELVAALLSFIVVLELVPARLDSLLELLTGVHLLVPVLVVVITAIVETGAELVFERLALLGELLLTDLFLIFIVDVFIRRVAVEVSDWLAAALGVAAEDDDEGRRCQKIQELAQTRAHHCLLRSTPRTVRRGR